MCFHRLVHFTAGVVLFEVFAFVVRLAAARKPDDDLHQSPLVEKHPKPRYRQAAILQRPLQLIQFLSVEQQLAVAFRDMVIAGSPMVFGNRDIADPQLALVEIAIAVHHRRLAQPHGLDLGTDQHAAGDELFENLVVERRPLVADIYRFIIAHLSLWL